MNRSIVIPVYKNELNIPRLLEALESFTGESEQVTEVVFVVDGSPDGSYALLKNYLQQPKFPSQLITHSRNFGSFEAIRTGMKYARGTFIGVMAADLQEPLSLIKTFFHELESLQFDIVFGYRMRRRDPLVSKFFSAVFWGLYRRFVVKDIPKGGVDVFACNRSVADAVLSIREPNSSLLAQLFWVGFRRTFVPYERLERKEGKSAWGFARKLRYMFDSIFSFSDLPIMLLFWVGVGGMVISSAVSVLVLLAWFVGWTKVSGYTPIMLAMLFFFSVTLFSQGILGFYLWRATENTKDRPQGLVSRHETFEAIDKLVS
ncbi:MAG: glycosyltransferase family 2 protein [Acidobacteria bacterium]|nr:glycosyltransferase family 2 protein [Acidobacteriota bacterium]